MAEMSLSSTPYPLLADDLRYEIFRWLRLPPQDWKRKPLGALLRFPIARAVHLAADFDQTVSAVGFAAASRRFLPLFIDDVQVQGVENIPQQGPLVVACNHPGTIDILAVAAQINRPDLKMVARDMPILRRLPGLHACMIYSTPDMNQRASVLRQVIQHLQAGGALLLCASGNLDPDPARMTNAEQALRVWTPSAALFLRQVVGAQGVVAISSRIIAEQWFRHPLARLRKNLWDRQFMAEFLQTATQILFPGRYRVSPLVTFSPAFTVGELAASTRLADLHAGLLEQARRLIRYHEDTQTGKNRISGNFRTFTES